MVPDLALHRGFIQHDENLRTYKVMLAAQELSQVELSCQQLEDCAQEM